MARFLENILYTPQQEGGRELWRNFVEGLITPDEVRDALLDRISAWLCGLSGVRLPPFDTWGAEDLVQSFEAVLFSRS